MISFFVYKHFYARYYFYSDKSVQYFRGYRNVVKLRFI